MTDATAILDHVAETLTNPYVIFHRANGGTLFSSFNFRSDRISKEGNWQD